MNGTEVTAIIPVFNDRASLETAIPKSIETLSAVKLEPALKDAEPESRWQFERMGYFCADRRDSRPGRLVFNRTVTLRDEWARIVKAGRNEA